MGNFMSFPCGECEKEQSALSFHPRNGQLYWTCECGQDNFLNTCQINSRDPFFNEKFTLYQHGPEDYSDKDDNTRSKDI